MAGEFFVSLFYLNYGFCINEGTTTATSQNTTKSDISSVFTEFTPEYKANVETRSIPTITAIVCKRTANEMFDLSLTHPEIALIREVIFPFVAR